MNIIIKKLLLALSVWIFIWFWLLFSYAVNITSITQSISSWAIIEAWFFTDLQDRIININWSWGNVWIWTTNPSYKLDVNWDILSSGWIRTGWNNGWFSQTFWWGWHMADTTWIRAYNGKSLRMATWLIGGDAWLSIWYGWTLTPAWWALIAWNVGIWTPTPTQKLDVRGSIKSYMLKFWEWADSGQSPDYYWIYQEAGAWTAPYPDLRISFHTWLKYDAYRWYGWHRFYTSYDWTGAPAWLVMQITDKVRVLEWWIEFPNGTVQTTAANGWALSIWGCYNVVVWEHETWWMCNTANNEVNVWVYQYIKDNWHIKILYIRCCKLSIN